MYLQTKWVKLSVVLYTAADGMNRRQTKKLHENEKKKCK